MNFEVSKVNLNVELDLYSAVIQELASDWEFKGLFWSAASLLDSLKNPDSRLWLAKVHGLVVGLAFFKTALDESELLYIHIRRSHRGKRFGEVLLKAALSELNLEGVKSIFLEVRPTNYCAIRLYKSCGFEETSRRSAYYKDGEDAVIMSYR